MNTQTKHIAIIGAGLVGSLLSIYLSRRGYRVSVFERRDDLRKDVRQQGRSINLALSARGIRALEEVGLAAEVRKLAVPMHGRMMHDRKGTLTFQPYGRQGQYINSISRAGLNGMLISKAEENNVRFFFNRRCTAVDLAGTSASFQSASGDLQTQTFDVVVGADGAFSAVRSAMQVTDRFDYSQEYLQHGYKELHIPAGKSGDHVMEKNALHIWPRESYMMIALPNTDGSFTCTLFFPFEGDLSFASLTDDDRIISFFKEVFPDALPLLAALTEEFNRNPTGSLVTVRCFPWVRNQTLLIGDAAHAIVPFYGQGMNAGFEDCRMLNVLLDQYAGNWPQALGTFQQMRKRDCDAISHLAYDNFVEMRDLVADPGFLLRKKIEAKIHELYPEKWIPLYSMVTFHDDISYWQAYTTGKKQEKIMDAVMSQPQISSRWQQLDFDKIVKELD
ncbi:MAG TPA: NAD(P)/FAD-dependent oxidoreductase [Chryseosolibacter sp.]